MFRFIFLIFFVSGFVTQVYAQGSFHFDATSYNFIADPTGVSDQNEFRFHASYRNYVSLGESFALKLQPGVKASSLSESSSRPVYFHPQELWIGYEGESLWTRAGYLTFNWEGTDVINPMDIAAMKDGSDPLNTTSLASPGVSMGMTLANGDFEVFFIPQQTKPITFGDESPWLPRKLVLPLQTDDVELRLPSEVSYDVHNLKELDDALESNAGFRWRLNWGAFDMAMASFIGSVQSPYLFPTVDVTPIQTSPKTIFQLQSPVILEPLLYSRQTSALKLAYSFDTVILRLASRYDATLTDDARLPTWSNLSVAGIEKAFTDFTLIAQAVVNRHPKSGALDTVGSLFEQGILLGLRWPATETQTVYIGAFRSLKDESLVAQAEWSLRINDYVTSSLEVEHINGPADELLGLLDDRSRANFNFQLSF